MTWRNVQRLPIATVTDHPTDKTKFVRGLALVDWGEPPEDFKPAIGDYFYTAELALGVYMGGAIPAGALFPVPAQLGTP